MRRQLDTSFFLSSRLEDVSFANFIVWLGVYTNHSEALKLIRSWQANILCHHFWPFLLSLSSWCCQSEIHSLIYLCTSETLTSCCYSLLTVFTWIVSRRKVEDQFNTGIASSGSYSSSGRKKRWCALVLMFFLELYQWEVYARFLSSSMSRVNLECAGACRAVIFISCMNNQLRRIERIFHTRRIALLLILSFQIDQCEKLHWHIESNKFHSTTWWTFCSGILSMYG